MTTIPQESPMFNGRQICLVRIYKSEVEVRLECAFTVVDLDDVNLDYSAISDVWGDPEIVTHIKCKEGYSLAMETRKEWVLLAALSGK